MSWLNAVSPLHLDELLIFKQTRPADSKSCVLVDVKRGRFNRGVTFTASQQDRHFPHTS